MAKDTLLLESCWSGPLPVVLRMTIPAIVAVANPITVGIIALIMIFLHYLGWWICYKIIGRNPILVSETWVQERPKRAQVLVKHTTMTKAAVVTLLFYLFALVFFEIRRTTLSVSSIL